MNWYKYLYYFFYRYLNHLGAGFSILSSRVRYFVLVIQAYLLSSIVSFVFRLFSPLYLNTTFFVVASIINILHVIYFVSWGSDKEWAKTFRQFDRIAPQKRRLYDILAFLTIVAALLLCKYLGNLLCD